MKYIRLYLKGFKPLLYGGTKSIELNELPQVNILSGENGKGKSSILRELTPYPATRTDYEKNGIKIIEIEHGGHVYTLTSDFRKTTAHSFTIDGGDELNISGTTEVQTDLVHQYFDGFTPLIDKLTSGQCKFSQLSRPERCKIIMATYPSSMLFILDKYKKLMTKIRSCTSQLKLMNERKLKLKESFIEDSTLKLHNKRKALMIDAINKIDQDIFMFKQYVKPLLEQRDPDYNTDYDSIVDTCADIYSDLNELTLDYMQLKYDNNDVSVTFLDEWIKEAEKQLTNITTRGTTIVEEIEKYHKYLSTDRDQYLVELKDAIVVQKDIIKKYTVTDDTPTVDDVELSQMKHAGSDIHEQLLLLHSYQLELWTEEYTITQEHKLHSLESDLRTKQIHQQSLESDIGKLRHRLKKYTDNPYAHGCTIKCKLRESIQDIIDSINLELSKIKEDHTKLLVDIKPLASNIEQLKTALQERYPSRTIIQKFERLTTNKYWGNFICSNLTFVEAANLNVFEIWNRYLRIIKKSESVLKVKEATEKLALLELKLEGLSTDNQPAKQVITDTLLKREQELKELTVDRIRINDKLANSKEELLARKRYATITNRANDIHQLWTQVKHQIELNAVIDFVKQICSDLLNTKNDITEKLRELEVVIKEQENLRTRLNDEVLPVIDELTSNLQQWNLIEQQLSPKSGLPYKNSIAYVNALFIHANMFIKQIWCYGMELEYLKDDEIFDGTFRVIINGDGVVKDISTCSKGQKEIIDLAIIMAICIYRKYTMLYPLKLDEMSSGLSPDHSNKLFEYLGELFSKSNILQAFIVNHDPVITSSYDTAGYVVLSEDYPLPTACNVVSKLNI